MSNRAPMNRTTKKVTQITATYNLLWVTCIRQHTIGIFLLCLQKVRWQQFAYLNWRHSNDLKIINWSSLIFIIMLNISLIWQMPCANQPLLRSRLYQLKISQSNQTDPDKKMNTWIYHPQKIKWTTRHTGNLTGQQLYHYLQKFVHKTNKTTT